MNHITLCGLGGGAEGHTFELTEPSAEAHDDALAARLWTLSAQLVGVPAEPLPLRA